MANSISAFESLKDDFFRYYDTPFKVRSPEIMNERKDLLDREGVIWREPWIELLRTYESTGQGKEQAILTAGGSEDLIDLIKCGLFDENIPDIYLHQKQTLEDSLAGKNVVVSSGTGSGKTESFLLPVLAQLIQESKSWGGSSPKGERWWEQNNSSWVPQRGKETGRTAAVRTLIMYPMNALVEDQLVRLRTALDSEKARDWFDNNRRGHRFYFGRYTGLTPVSGKSDNENRINELKSTLADIGERADKVIDDPERRPFIPQIGGAEMMSRWDMQEHPPDILISNYSMLNIMFPPMSHEPCAPISL